MTTNEAPAANAPASLYAALARAITRAHAVEHDAQNPHHRYSYASAEAVLGESRAALAPEGLSLVPISSTPTGADGSYMLDVAYLLAHSSGESMIVSRSWPIVVGNGRPLDKALAGASTTCLAYTLRDILLLPRGDSEADPDQRDDRDTTPRQAPKSAPPAPKGPPKAPKSPPKATPDPAVEELTQDIRKLVRGAPFAAQVEADITAAGTDVKRLAEIRDAVRAS